MKNLFFILLLFMMLSISSCNQQIDYEAEVKAIKEVCMNETKLYSKQDLPGVYKHMIMDSTSVRMGTGSLEHNEMFGWKRIKAFYKKVDEADWSDYDIQGFKFSDWHMKVYPESAFAIYKQLVKYKYQGMPDEVLTREIRVLEKDKGKWKIVLLHYVDLTSYEEEEPGPEPID